MIAPTPEDFVDFVRCLRQERCEFLIVGAHALTAHGAPRATGSSTCSSDRIDPAGGSKDLADAEVLEEIRARAPRS